MCQSVTILTCQTDHQTIKGQGESNAIYLNGEYSCETRCNPSNALQNGLKWYSIIAKLADLQILGSCSPHNDFPLPMGKGRDGGCMVAASV